jgi:hypothetical protein
MPLWYTIPNTITSPLQIDGLIGWYASNSAQFGPNDFLIRWQDLSSCKNDLVPYYSNIRNDFLFTDTVLINESPLNLDKISSGATVFIVGDLNNSNFFNSTFISLFTNTFENNSQTDDLRINIRNAFLMTNTNLLFIGSSRDLENGEEYPYLDGNKHLLNAICFNTNLNKGYINNSNKCISQFPEIITTDINNFNIFIGDYTARGGGYGISNYIFEILLYNKVLAESDINFINNYLATKHGIILNNNFVY